ncbi:uncharacterized protein QC761_117553 [Podospora bellae-mahoneyi]|uniref:Uncharacterized protein n=1 Tax=Podospora bellae-mahoneyi TaxID=2093777 RepID=A0ABR0G0M3_9PEZI|nr:hypothetical protein QC761_117553 [Podospora bellae-mahoneyi]
MSKKKMVMEEEPANCLSLPGEFVPLRLHRADSTKFSFYI